MDSCSQIWFFCLWTPCNFLATHLPAYLADRGLSEDVGAWALATIGLMNIFGSLAAGFLGDRMLKTSFLCLLYLGRTVLFVTIMLVPLTSATTLNFAAAIGLLWLNTVPVTSALVAHFFGPQYMATLFGLVFFSH